MIRMTVGQALAEVPVNIAPLIDDTDFKTRETAIAYNAAGMDLVWNFVDANGNLTQTAVTPTTAGVHDWTHQGDGMYTIEIPASGGTINNNAIGFGWFTGFVTGVLPWRGPIIEFGVPTGISGTFSGTHSATTSDLGANAPANDITGMTLFNPTDGESRIVTAYNTGTGVATHAAWDTAAGVTNGEPWVLFPTAPIDTVTLAAIQAELEENGASILDTLQDRLTAARATNLDELGSANIPADIDTLLTRIVGTLAAGTHNPQSGDAFSRIGAAGAGLTAVQLGTDAVDADALATAGIAEIVAAIFARAFDATDMSGLTFEELVALMACVLLGKASGLGTTTATFRNIADGADAVVATVDADGNRTAVTRTLTAVR